jgi:hypothetical protein
MAWYGMGWMGGTYEDRNIMCTRWCAQGSTRYREIILRLSVDFMTTTITAAAAAATATALLLFILLT